jgi:hypothetical protein
MFISCSFLFGSLIKFEASGPLPSDDSEIAHVHAMGQVRPECCFIRVPSAFAAASGTISAGKESAAPDAKGLGDARGVGGLVREFGIPPSQVGGALGGVRPPGSPRFLPFD